MRLEMSSALKLRTAIWIITNERSIFIGCWMCVPNMGLTAFLGSEFLFAQIAHKFACMRLHMNQVLAGILRDMQALETGCIELIHQNVVHFLEMNAHGASQRISESTVFNNAVVDFFLFLWILAMTHDMLLQQFSIIVRSAANVTFISLVVKRFYVNH